MSDAKIEIVFVDDGDSIPSQPPTSTPPKPSDTASHSASDTNPDGIEPPAPAGPRKTKTTAPVKDDADKGMSDFFGVLKESGGKIADVFGVGLIYRKIAELIGGITDVVSLFKKVSVPGESGPVAKEDEIKVTGDAAQDVDRGTGPIDLPLSGEEADAIKANQHTDALANLPKGKPTKSPAALPGPVATKTALPAPVAAKTAASTATTAATSTASTAATTATSAAPVVAPAAGAIAALGPFAVAVAGATAAIVAGAVIMKLAFDAIHRQVSEIEGYSADVGMAAAQSEVRSELATMRRAERIGGDVAGFEQVRGRMEAKLYDLQTEILKALLNMYKMIEPLVEAAGVGIDLASASLAISNTIADATGKIAMMDFAGAVKVVQDGNQRVQDIIKRSADDIVDAVTDQDIEFNDPWMEQWANIAGAGMPRVAGAPMAPGQLPPRRRGGP